MTKSKLAITCLLTASILSPMCVNALTQEEVADIAAASQSAAALTAEQKRAVLVRLNEEIGSIREQILFKKSELTNDKNMRAITLTLTAAGALVTGYLLFGRSEAGMRGLENVYYAAFTTTGTVPFAALTYSLNKQVNLSIDDIHKLDIQLTEAQKQFKLQLSALN